MKRLAVLALLCAGCVQAQFSIATISGNGEERAIVGIVETEKVQAGGFQDIRVRLRNTGEATAALSRLRITGVGFSLLGQPPLPHLVAPGLNVDFRVRFLPAQFGIYSGTLEVNETVVLFRGVSPQGITVLVEQRGRLETATETVPVVAGRVEVGKSAGLRLVVRNDAAGPLVVGALTVQGEAFSLYPAPALPLPVEPGRSAEFELRFAPLRVGVAQGTLLVDTLRIALEGFAIAPPFPAAILSLEPALASGRQGRIALRLDAPPLVSAAGTLTLEFRSAVTVGGDDPAIVFLNGASRSVAVAVRQGETNLGEWMFQTGSTAGEIRFRLQLGDQRWEAAAAIAPAMVAVDAVRGVRTATGVQVDITGFDNSRTASTLGFRFFDRQGNALGGDVLRADAASGFQSHFRTANVGGLFLLRAVFPVGGDTALIGAVEVEIDNAQGRTRASRASF